MFGLLALPPHRDNGGGAHFVSALAVVVWYHQRKENGMSIRKLRAYLALALYALAFVVAATHDSIARSAEMSGLSYDGTMDRVAVIVSVIIASALFGWNVGEAVAHREPKRRPLSVYEYALAEEHIGATETHRRYFIR